MSGCTIDLGILPDLSGILPLDSLTTGICGLIKSGTAFVNPLVSVINVGVTSIDTSVGVINTELSQMATDISQLTTWESTPPGSWTSQDMTDIKTAMQSKETCANDRKTASNSLRTKINTDFKNHTDILSGVNLAPSDGSPNVFARSGLNDAVNITRKQFGDPTTIETANMFGSIFDGEEVLGDVQLETDKLPVGSVIALDVTNRINTGTPGDKTAIINDINNLTCLPSGTLTTFENQVQGLIDGDENTYTQLANEILACLGSLSVSSWVNNPFNLQLLNCIGSVALKTLAQI